MPIGYAVDPAQRTVFVRGWGILTERDLDEQRAALLEDPHFDPDFAALVDLTPVSAMRVSSAFITRYATPFSDESRRVVVTDSDLVFGMSRMYGALLDGGRDSFAVERDRDAGLEWVGLPRGHVMPSVLDATFGDSVVDLPASSA